jgi:hypothetical protein
MKSATTPLTAEDALEAITPADLKGTIEDRIKMGMAIELLPRRNPDSHYGKHGAADYIGPALMSSSSQYKRARAVVAASLSETRPPHLVAHARAIVDEMNAGTITISHAYEKYRVAEKNEWAAQLSNNGLPLVPPPMANARTPKARKLRMEWVRALAGKGATSEEIATKLGLSHAGARKIIRDMGIVVKADAALMRTQRKVANPTRAMTVVVDDLEALVWSLDRINPADLDQDQVKIWADQLREHARLIERMSRRMTKELK